MFIVTFYISKINGPRPNIFVITGEFYPVGSGINNVSDLKFIYKNSVINQIYICNIHVENNGNLPVLKDDYDIPFHISRENEDYIHIDVVRKSSDLMNIRWNISDTSWKIEPFLLQEKENFSIRIVSIKEENVQFLSIESKAFQSIQNQQSLSPRIFLILFKFIFQLLIN